MIVDIMYLLKTRAISVQCITQINAKIFIFVKNGIYKRTIQFKNQYRNK